MSGQADSPYEPVYWCTGCGKIRKQSDCQRVNLFRQAVFFCACRFGMKPIADYWNRNN